MKIITRILAAIILLSSCSNYYKGITVTGRNAVASSPPLHGKGSFLMFSSLGSFWLHTSWYRMLIK